MNGCSERRTHNVSSPNSNRKSLPWRNQARLHVYRSSERKQAVAKQVSEQYNVTVTSVRVVLRKGKATKFSRGRHAYPGTTYRQDKKIAYVTLKEGDKIKVFDEEPVEEATDKKADKKADKKGDK